MPTYEPRLHTGGLIPPVSAGTGDIWMGWNQTVATIQPNVTYPQVTGYAGGDAVWPQWYNEATTVNIQINAQFNGETWTTWNSQPLYQPFVWADNPRMNAPLTAAQIDAYAVPDPEAEKRRRMIQANRDRAASLRRKLATRRAERLLLDHLDLTQQVEWDQDKAFHVVTADGLRRYRIAKGMAGNVKLVGCDGEAPMSKHGRPIYVGAKFCAHVYHPGGWVPDEDNVLTQALYLTDPEGEREFLAMANVS